MEQEKKFLEENELEKEEMLLEKEEAQGYEEEKEVEEIEGEKEEEEKKDSLLKKIVTELFSWVKMFVVAFVVCYLLFHYVIINANVPTSSMSDTIKVGDRVIANRLAYIGKAAPKRGDIIIFLYPDNEKEIYIKRVIGLPGETVEIIEGQTYINGEALDEPYLKEEMLGSFGPYEVPEGSYFVMGDNRNESSDARYWENTYVKEEKILGKAVLRLFPNPTMLH